MKQNSKLNTGQKLDLIITIFNHQTIRPILNGLTNVQLVEAHQFLWDKVVEIHYLTQEKEFNREDVTGKMMPSATYQHQQECDLRLDYCKGVECIWSNPICAGNKIKSNMEVMANKIIQDINMCKTKNKKQKDKNYNDREEVKVWL